MAALLAYLHTGIALKLEDNGAGNRRLKSTVYLEIAMATEKTFYLETFGCQMNAHDSEKVIGTLQQRATGRSSREEDAGLILYNTCSIRDKAEQKVFHRLNEYKRSTGNGKRFAVLGCVAQQEGEKIFERAPYVSLVSGSASYRKLPEMLARLEAGETASPASTTARPTRPSRPSSPPARTPIAATSPSSRAATSSAPTAWCRTRAARSAAAPFNSVLAEARRIADQGYTEIQLLGQNVNSYRDPEGKRSFAELLAAVGEVAASAGCASPPATRATLPATSSRPSTPCPRSATTCTCRCSRVLRGFSRR
jgi:tRNA-2-methylthio-N6-dimethylallyladenosine synthase